MSTSLILTGKTMGTYWQVKIKNNKKNQNLQKLIQKTLDQDENMLSSWKEKSIVYKFNKSKKNILQPINKKMFHILTTVFKISKKTYGKLDITIGALINMWGFGTKKKPLMYPSNQMIKNTISITGMKHIKIIHQCSNSFLTKDIDELEINLSTIGEGFAVDHLSYILQKKGFKNYTISVGGAVLIKINNPKKQDKIIAIQKPTDREKSIYLLVKLRNHVISTAGSYRNYYQLNGKKLSHIIDPQTGKPIQHNLISVSVIASTGLEADSWDTSLLVLGVKKAKKIAIKEKLAVCFIIKKKICYTHGLHRNLKNL